MKKKIGTIHRLVLFLLLASWLLAAAAPAPAQLTTPTSAQASQSVARLTVNNKSSSTIYLYLTGPATYFLTVKAETKAEYTVFRGEYDYRVTGCGVTATGTLDLNANYTLVNPVCGGNAGRGRNQEGKLDLSKPLKVVPVTLKNQAGQQLFVILTGPESYVYWLNDKDEKKLTIQRGTYKVKVYGCRSYAELSWEAYKGAKLYLTCPGT